MGIVKIGRLVLPGALLLLVTGCATLKVTPKQAFEPGGEKQPVTLGIQSFGDSRQETLETPSGVVIIGIETAVDRLVETLDAPEDSVVKAATGTLFEKVVLLPKESEAMQSKEIQSTYKVDYILSVGIGPIKVNHNMNPLWFASFPMLFFKMYAPIVTFKPEVSLQVQLSDAATGVTLLQKKVLETSTDHFAPKNPRPEVRKLISLTINNAMVSIMRDAQQSVAAARQEKK